MVQRTRRQRVRTTAPAGALTAMRVKRVVPRLKLPAVLTVGNGRISEGSAAGGGGGEAAEADGGAGGGGGGIG